MTSSIRSPLHRRLARISMALLTQLALAGFALGAATMLRFDGAVPASGVILAATLLPYLLIARLVSWHYGNFHRVVWEHVGLRDLAMLASTSALGTVIAIPLLLIGDVPLDGPTRTLLALELLIVVSTGAALLAGTRLAREHRRPRRAPAATRAFIIGAGEAGEQLLRHLQHGARDGVTVVGLIDDDPAKRDRALHGVPVLGDVDALRTLAAVHGVTQALVAIPSLPPEGLRRIVARCREAAVEMKLLPPMVPFGSAEVQARDLRAVRIEDLLQRAPIELDLAPVRREIAGAVVAITGGAGSIGSEIARQVAAIGAREVLIVDRADSPLHAITCELAARFPDLLVRPVLCSVTNAERLERVLRQHRPAVVYHAAAYKQLPMLESNVVEGLWNNVIGTLRAARAASRAGARRFVLISTDKAVNPSSVLGVTKLLAERVVLELPSLRGSGTDFRVVRFGNVLGSEGSVVPFFAQQLAAGGPLTVTHPDVKRFFMTIPEAAQLVLQASAMEEAAGRIAVLEMGEQVRIVDLAEQMILLAGRVPHEDVRIVFTGLRPGEKLAEELLGPGETATSTSNGRIQLVERVVVDRGDLARQLRQLTALASRGDELALIRALVAIAPEYRPELIASLPPWARAAAMPEPAALSIVTPHADPPDTSPTPPPKVRLNGNGRHHAVRRASA